MGAPPRGAQSSGTRGRAPRLMRTAADAGQAERRRLQLEEDVTAAAAAQAEEYTKEVQEPHSRRAPKRSADEAEKDGPAKRRGKQQPAADDEDTDDEDESTGRPKKRRKPRPKLAAPPPAPVPSPAAQLAALAKLPGGEQLLKLMGSQKGTAGELALDAARRSDTVLKPPAHKPLAIKKAKKSNRGRGGAKVGRDGGISAAAKRKAAGAGQFGTRKARAAISEARKLKAKKTLSKAERAKLKELEATAKAGSHAAINVKKTERKGADRRQCPFCSWCCSISPPETGDLSSTAMARHIQREHTAKRDECKPWGPFLKQLPKEKK